MKLIKGFIKYRQTMKKQIKVPSDPEVIRRSLRFLVLVLLTMTCFSQYFIFDQPALLKQEIIKIYEPIYGAQATNFYFSFLYSFYSIPNIILPLVGGLLCDRFGYQKTAILYCLCIVAGQGTVYFASSLASLKFMVFGRFIYGLGGESITKWFGGKELSFANSLNLSLLRSATVLNTILSPKIAEHKGITQAFGFGFFLTFLSFISLILLIYIDAFFDSRAKKNDSDIINESNQIVDIGEIIKETKQDIVSFPKLFWTMTALMATFYVTVLVFISFSSSIITEIWLPSTNSIEQNEAVAGELMGVPYMCCTFLSPIVGFLIDQKGQRIKFMITSCVLVFIGLLSILLFYPIYSMIFIGVGYAVFASIVWSSVIFVIQQDKLGTAFGVMGSIQNFAFFLTPLLIALINSQGSQITVVVFFLLIACISLIISIWMFKEDYQRKVSLDCPDQKLLMAQLKIENSSQQKIKLSQNDEEEQLVNDKE